MGLSLSMWNRHGQLERRVDSIHIGESGLVWRDRQERAFTAPCLSAGACPLIL